MSKKLMEQVTKALKDAGVELKAEIKTALSDVLGSDALKEAGLVELGSGEIIVKESDHNDVRMDLRKWKDKAREVTDERDRLKNALDTGDSENKKLADRFRADVEKMTPLNEKLMKRARADWSSKSAQIPAEAKADAKDDEKKRITTIRGKFVFPEKDKELESDQILANLDKYEELSELGVFGEQKPAPAPQKSNPPTPRQPVNSGGEVKTTDEAWVDFFEGSTAGNAR